jgi:hypothetical protein
MERKIQYEIFANEEKGFLSKLYLVFKNNAKRANVDLSSRILPKRLYNCHHYVKQTAQTRKTVKYMKDMKLLLVFAKTYLFDENLR